jgi:hypothetical protein
VRAPSILKTAPFSLANRYNPATTRKPVIYQFNKISLLVSALMAASYRKVKICARIQWTLPNKKNWQLSQAASSLSALAILSITKVP